MSSETKHTPGHWEAAEYPVVFAPYPKDSVAMVEVANCMLDRDIFDQWQANARLIAAAPELLAELTATVEELEELRDRHLLHAAAVTRALVQKRIDAARDAIAKATGQEASND